MINLNNIPKIALLGQMGAGKDFLASQLEDHTRVALGDPIKLFVKMIREGYPQLVYDCLRRHFNYNYQLNDIIAKVAEIPYDGGKDRAALQYLGYAVNDEKADVWIQMALWKA